MKPLSRQKALHKALDNLRTRYVMKAWQCTRCDHKWVARNHAYRTLRGGRPVSCPRCKRRNWWIEAGILQKRRLPFRPCCEDRAAYGTPHKATCTREGAI